MKTILKIIIPILVVAVVLSGIGVYYLILPAPVDVAEVREYSDLITENMLLGVNENNYTKFSEHFDENMKEAVPEPLPTLRAEIGDYIPDSKEFWKAERQAQYTIVYYKAKFTEESVEVTVQVVFSKIGEKAYVSGLWFDSPKLRE